MLQAPCDPPQAALRSVRGRWPHVRLFAGPSGVTINLNVSTSRRTAFIRAFAAPDKRISIYVFGDEFTGESITSVIDTVDRINRSDANGRRLVRIQGVGFPTQFSREANMQTTGIRFATLMRELTHRNGGTLVLLNDFR